MSIKAVIFDIGGVLLLQNTKLNPSNDQKWKDHIGIQKGDVFTYINRSGLSDAATRGKISSQEVWRRVSEHFKIDLEQMRELEADSQTSEILNTELVEFLKSLRPHYKVALLSNAWSGTREALNRKYGLDKLVDIMLYSAEEGTLKPEAKFYLLALHRLGVQPNETIFLDNVMVNVDGASLFGIHSILYKDNAQAIAEINKLFQSPQAERKRA
jgi:epoxide hydrolase-like predicted phosphatase